jgi:hypothetical protein
VPPSQLSVISRQPRQLPAFPQLHSDHHNNNSLLRNFIGKLKALITKLIDVEKTRQISKGSLFSLRFETSSNTLGRFPPISTVRAVR